MSFRKYKNITSMTSMKDDEDREVNKLQWQTITEKLMKTSPATRAYDISWWRMFQESLNLGDEHVEIRETVTNLLDQLPQNEQLRNLKHGKSQQLQYKDD